MAPSTSSPWFLRTGPQTGASGPILFCFPHGGAGPSVFRDWQVAAGQSMEIVPVQLPGRERRLTEPPVESITDLSHQLADHISAEAGSRHYAFLGHSMGALIAYELCHDLRSSPNPPALLAVTGAPAAHLPRTTADVSRLPDAEFRQHVAGLNGTHAELLADDGWLDLLIPLLRSDFAACENYRDHHVDRLEIPVLALAGADDPVATPATVERWADLSAVAGIARTLPGDHFFPFEHPATIIDLVRSTLDATR